MHICVTFIAFKKNVGLFEEEDALGYGAACVITLVSVNSSVWQREQMYLVSGASA